MAPPILVAALVAAPATGASTAKQAAPVQATPLPPAPIKAARRPPAGFEGKVSGDADRDFVSLMIAHHLQGIEMAQAELKRGRDERLRRVAKEIIAGQERQIAALRLALGKSPSPAVAAPENGSVELADGSAH